jgi:hypothetical protein
LWQFYNQNTTKKYFDKLFIDKSIKKQSKNNYTIS